MDSKTVVTESSLSNSRGRIVFQCISASLYVGVLLAILLTTYQVVSQDQTFRKSIQEKTQNAAYQFSLRQTYWELASRLVAKINLLYELEKENTRLRLENAKLRQANDHAEFQRNLEKDEQLTSELIRTHHEKTGSPAGRTMDTISYRPPEQILPFQLYTLGISYFKEKRFEKAAVIFSQLIRHQGEVSYATPKNLLVAGISWYRLHNFILADTYLNEAMKKAQDEPGSEAILSQCRLWKALIAKRLNKKVHAQYWLNELIEQDPSSPEARWMTSKQVKNAESSQH